MKCILIVLIIFVQLVYTKRISELKCEEYSKISKSSQRKYPHLVYLTIGIPSGTVYGDLGTLLSRRFVATSSYASVLIPSKTKVYFNPNDEYNVIEKYFHPTLNYTSTHAVAFLKLDKLVMLDSFHRPACLWQKDFFYESFASTLKWIDNSFAPHSSDWTSNKIETTELIILRDSDCAALNYLLNPTFICLQPRGQDKQEYWPTHGTPIQIEINSGELPSNYYMLGQYLFYYATTVHQIVGTKMSAHLDWLDNLLWQEEDSKCGKRFKQPNLLVIEGQPAIRGEFPWHAAISRKEDLGVQRYICGGSLLNKNSVLTAAHCVYGSNGRTPPGLLLVSLGKYDLDDITSYSRQTTVYQIIIHEQYDPHQIENDISILKLKTEIVYSDFIQPICITGDSNIFHSDIGVVPGWGKDVLQQQTSILSKASLPIHPRSECLKNNREVFEKFLTEKTFCAGYGNGTSVCSGDSGGGLILESDKVFYIRGIVSLGVPLKNETRCDATQYVVFTDVTKFYDWLVSRINN